MNELDIAAMRAELLARLAAIKRQSAATSSWRKPVELDQSSIGRLTRMDAIQEQEMALGAERRRAVERRRIEEALRRIDAGEYGACVNCGAPIAPRRLALDPAAPTCITCAR